MTQQAEILDQGTLPAPRPRWHSVAGFALMALGGAFLVRLLLQSSGDLAALSWKPSAAAITLSMIFQLACLGCAPLMWRRVLLDFHHRLAYWEAFAIYYVTALAKYVPGSIWGYVGMAHYGKRLALSTGTTFLSILVQHAVICGGSVLAFGVALLLWPDGGWTTLGLTAVLWLSGVLVLLSPVPKRVLGTIASRTLGHHVRPRFTRTALIVALAWFLLSWFLFAVGYYWLLQTFYPVSFRHTLIFTGIYGISWLSGFLAFLSPSGLGVREGVQAYLLSFFIPAPIAVTIALVQRIWLTIGDLLVGVVALRLLRRLG